MLPHAVSSFTISRCIKEIAVILDVRKLSHARNRQHCYKNCIKNVPYKAIIKTFACSPVYESNNYNICLLPNVRYVLSAGTFSYKNEDTLKRTLSTRYRPWWCVLEKRLFVRSARRKSFLLRYMSVL